LSQLQEPLYPERARAWDEARSATQALREAIDKLGLHDAFPHMQADVNVYGDGIVHIGRVTPEIARRIADVLESGRQLVFDKPRPPKPPPTHRLDCE
jgi:hypothetical protein